MKANKLVIFLIAIMLISISTTYLFYVSFIVVGKDEVPIDFQISDTFGFNLDTDAMHLGAFNAGASSAHRGMIVHNRFDFPVTVEVRLEGIDPTWIRIIESTFHV